MPKGKLNKMIGTIKDRSTSRLPDLIRVYILILMLSLSACPTPGIQRGVTGAWTQIGYAGMTSQKCLDVGAIALADQAIPIILAEAVNAGHIKKEDYNRAAARMQNRNICIIQHPAKCCKGTECVEGMRNGCSSISWCWAALTDKDGNPLDWQATIVHELHHMVAFQWGIPTNQKHDTPWHLVSEPRVYKALNLK